MKIADVSEGNHFNNIARLPVDNKKIECTYYFGHQLIFTVEKKIEQVILYEKYSTY